MKLREWNAHLHGLVVFRALLNDPVVAKLLDLTDRMEAGSTSYGPVCDAVAAFEAALFEYTTNWGSYLSSAVLEAETICVRQAAAGQLDALLQSALDSELQFLQQLCGLTLDEPAADLAAVVAIASRYLDKPVPGTMAAVGEVGLSGEIRSITHMEQRLSEVKRLGFTQCMVPAHKVKDLRAPAGLELLPVANISRALQLLARGQ